MLAAVVLVVSAALLFYWSYWPLDDILALPAVEAVPGSILATLVSAVASNTPTEQNSAAGPYDRWPLGRGFERYYGFLGGETNQYYPELVYDNHQVLPPSTPEEGYHLTPDLVDKAIQFIADGKQIAPQKPFFMYFCSGAAHAPHHVPREWADKYKGKFDDGWEAYREKTFQRQRKMGIAPADAELSRHDPP